MFQMVEGYVHWPASWLPQGSPNQKRGDCVFKLIPTDEKFFEMFTKQAEYFCRGTALVREKIGRAHV